MLRLLTKTIAIISIFAFSTSFNNFEPPIQSDLKPRATLSFCSCIAGLTDNRPNETFWTVITADTQSGFYTYYSPVSGGDSWDTNYVEFYITLNSSISSGSIKCFNGTSGLIGCYNINSSGLTYPFYSSNFPCNSKFYFVYSTSAC